MAATTGHALDGGFDQLPGTARINRMLVEEMGQEMADAYLRARAAQERWARARHPNEGLRERKKRPTLFLVRGFERVTVAQIAEIVGVSEKTVYNYFPTKESLVFDEADEGSERLARELRERGPGETPTRVMVRELTSHSRRLEDLPDESHLLLPLFAEMVATTPALRAAWLELQDRLVDVVTTELARHAELDPREPEPSIAARAIVALFELSFQSRIRHVEAGLRGAALAEAVTADIERAARLLDTGLWSFNLLTQTPRNRSQLAEAAVAAEQARKQVMDALKQARTAWHDLRGQAKDDSRHQRQRAKLVAKEQSNVAREELKRAAIAQASAIGEEAKRAAKAQMRAAKEEVKRAAKEQAVAIREEAKSAARGEGRKRAAAPPDARAYEHFRDSMAERHAAIRERQLREVD
jgi:AcrR family transcriptional regulator